jgi:hypothetical protein
VGNLRIGVCGPADDLHVDESSEGQLTVCLELLEILYANQDHVKLRVLTADIEDVRDRLIAASGSGPRRATA